MTFSASRPSRASIASTPVVLTVLAIGTALAPFSTKIAGAVWLLWCLWGIGLRLAPSTGQRPVPHAALPAAHALAACCAAAMGLAMLKAGYWNDPLDEIYAYLRLLLCAAAAWWVLSRAVLPNGIGGAIGNTLAAQCAAAFACIAWVVWRYPDPRSFLPANAIPWAQAIAFGLCLLMPLVLAAAPAPAWRQRCWWLALGLGSAAVLMSQSRGAFGVFAWMLWLLAMHWRESHGGWPLRRLALLAVATCVAAAAVWWAPGDPLRVRLAEREINQAETSAVYDTSMGTRLYLWGMAWKGLRESPLVGVGEAERYRRIRRAGDELPEPRRERLASVRTMGHVHNQYLHAAFDGGMVGLGAVLAVIAGLATAAWRLRKVDALASRQMQGLLFLHVAGSVTNVNFAHNYYVVTLSIACALVLLGTCAGRTSGVPASWKPPGSPGG